MRVVFATEPENEAEVRRRIDRAVREGSVTSPGGKTSHWYFLDSKAGVPSESQVSPADFRRIAGP